MDAIPELEMIRGYGQLDEWVAPVIDDEELVLSGRLKQILIQMGMDEM